MPESVLTRAEQLLSELAVQHVAHVANAIRSRKGRRNEAQLQLFTDPGREVAAALLEVDAGKVTPEQALALLRQWKQQCGG